MTDGNPQKSMFSESMIEGPDQFNRRQRFKAIHNARQQVFKSLSQDDEAHEGHLIQALL
jgi:hypothetical protein